MTDPTTVNKLLSVPTQGSDSGTWATPVNADFTAIDGMLGGVVSISLSSSNVTLTAPSGTTTPGAGPYQSQNAVLKFSGVLTANVIITLPLPGYYIVRNNCTGAFYVQLSGGSGNKIGAPPGMSCKIFSDGTDCDYVSLGMPGEYVDLAVSSLPTWMSACTVAPYLTCDGTAYSRTTYAALFAVVSTSFGTGDGSTTFNVPDLRNRARYPVGGASGRITVAGGNFDGTTLGTAGGAQNSTAILAHTHVASVTDPGHFHLSSGDATLNSGGSGPSMRATYSAGAANQINTSTKTTGVTVSNATSGSGSSFPIIAPALVSGLALIKT